MELVHRAHKAGRQSLQQLRGNPYRGSESTFLRQSLPAQQSPGPFEAAEKPRKRGLLQTKLLTATSAKNAVLVSLSPVVSKAPDFAILVRNFKRFILNGYSARRARTFRIPFVTRGVLRSKRGVELMFEFRAQLILRYCISARNSDPGLTPVTKSQSRARVQATYSSDLSVL